MPRTPTAPTVWFPRPGKANTGRTLAAALVRARELRIGHLVVASTTGATALRLARLAGHSTGVVCVTHHAGFGEPGACELPDRTENALAALGVPVLRTTHLMAGLDRAVRLKFGGLGPAEVVAATCRTFGEGTKVALEVAVMALDAGLVPYGRDVIAVGGTGEGADTALVVRPAHSKSFFDTIVREVVCKPRTR
ncbi:hypothetical protein FJY71_09700 [candidate division WOR-3 bacterium]|nr:hypothetical protein [candidate division WOR-3 bacterium]